MTQLVNQFEIGKEKGQLDLAKNWNSISVRASEALVAGQKVKIVDNSYGIPEVVACDDTTVAFGFMNYSLKNSSIASGKIGELSMDGNVMYMIAGAAISAYADVMYVAATGKVITAAGTTTKWIDGFAIDKATADGDLIRVSITCNRKQRPTA